VERKASPAGVFGGQCLEVVGEWWSMLVCATHSWGDRGSMPSSSVGISATSSSSVWRGWSRPVCSAGAVLEHPPRYDYRLTDKAAISGPSHRHASVGRPLLGPARTTSRGHPQGVRVLGRRRARVRIVRGESGTARCEGVRRSWTSSGTTPTGSGAVAVAGHDDQHAGPPGATLGARAHGCSVSLLEAPSPEDGAGSARTIDRHRFTVGGSV